MGGRRLLVTCVDTLYTKLAHVRDEVICLFFCNGIVEGCTNTWKELEIAGDVIER